MSSRIALLLVGSVLVANFLSESFLPFHRSRGCPVAIIGVTKWSLMSCCSCKLRSQCLQELQGLQATRLTLATRWSSHCTCRYFSNYCQNDYQLIFRDFENHRITFYKQVVNPTKSIEGKITETLHRKRSWNALDVIHAMEMVINIANDCNKNKYYVVDILVQVYNIYEYYLFKKILFIYNFQI